MIFSYIIKIGFKILGTPILKREYKTQVYSPNERILEYSFVLNQIKKMETLPIKILDIGPGTSSLPSFLNSCGSIITAIDTVKDYWGGYFFNRHFFVLKKELSTLKKEQFDLITCISTLEHVKNYEQMLFDIYRLLKKDGILILTFPYKDEFSIDNIYDWVKDGVKRKYICRVFSEKNVKSITKDYKVLEVEKWKCWKGGSWRINGRLKKPLLFPLNVESDLICLCLKKV